MSHVIKAQNRLLSCNRPPRLIYRPLGRPAKEKQSQRNRAENTDYPPNPIHVCTNAAGVESRAKTQKRPPKKTPVTDPTPRTLPCISFPRRFATAKNAN